MSNPMSFHQFNDLLKYIVAHNSPSTAKHQWPSIKYVDPHFDMRNNSVFSVALRPFNGVEVIFHTQNECRDLPKSLYERIKDYLDTPIESKPAVVPVPLVTSHDTGPIWNLFLDDIRDVSYVKNDGRIYMLARNVSEAKQLILTQGVPAHISFDHDLGSNSSGEILPSGYDLAKWMIDRSFDSVEYNIPESFSWSVHSSNPVGKVNINGLLKSYMNFMYVDNENFQ